MCLICRFLVPGEGSVEILLNSDAKLIEVGEGILRLGVALVGRHSDPAVGLGKILGNHVPVTVLSTEMPLRFMVALLGSQLSIRSGCHTIP